MQLTLFDTNSELKSEKQLLYDLFLAYYDARKNKRNTKSALDFEQGYEHKLFELYEDIKNRQYKIKPSICFINYSPVQREIFAAHFRDRIVHHLVYNYISPIFERVFINDSYSCRRGKGTSYGIKRIDKFIRSCSNNYKTDCYILRLDIKGYFMAINKTLLFDKTMQVLETFRYRNVKNMQGEIIKWNNCFCFDTVYYLLKEIIFNDPTLNFIRKGSIDNWNGLPPSKSLFYSNPDCGLPIGNLTSQLFSNIYLNDFDHWILNTLTCKYYGRYVDDFVIVHNNKEYLKYLISMINEYLKQNCSLELHPRKIYLQHFSKGVKFLGAVIKPHRIYLSNRTKGNFYNAISYQNKVISNNAPIPINLLAFQSSINSYLGIMKHYKSYNLRKKITLKKINSKWWDYFYLNGKFEKFKRKRKPQQQNSSFGTDL